MTREPDTTPLSLAIAAAETEYNADIYFYSGPIDDNGIGQLASAVTQHQSHDKAVLILTTNGGLANAAYQIARLMQDQYEDWALFCPSRCKSAGTLIALGATSLIMDVFSELGPLDVQLIKQNEIALRKSGLLSKSSFDALADSSFELYERLMINITARSRGNVSFKMASELAASMTSTLLAPVYAQVNPDVVGSENRDLSIAFEYGSRLVKVSKNVKDNAVQRLVYQYPSHDFVIDVNEARELFKRVETPKQNLYTIVGLLGGLAYDESPVSVICALHPMSKQEDGDEERNEGPAPANEVDDSGDANRSSDPEPATGANDRAPAADTEGAAEADDAGRISARGSLKIRPIKIQSV